MAATAAGSADARLDSEAEMPGLPGLRGTVAPWHGVGAGVCLAGLLLQVVWPSVHSPTCWWSQVRLVGAVHCPSHQSARGPPPSRCKPAGLNQFYSGLVDALHPPLLLPRFRPPSRFSDSSPSAPNPVENCRRCLLTRLTFLPSLPSSVTPSNLCQPLAHSLPQSAHHVFLTTPEPTCQTPS